MSASTVLAAANIANSIEGEKKADRPLTVPARREADVLN